MATTLKKNAVSELIDEDIEAIRSQLNTVDAEDKTGHLQLNPHGTLLTLARTSLEQHVRTLELLRRTVEALKPK